MWCKGCSPVLCHDDTSCCRLVYRRFGDFAVCELKINWSEFGISQSPTLAVVLHRLQTALPWGICIVTKDRKCIGCLGAGRPHFIIKIKGKRGNVRISEHWGGKAVSITQPVCAFAGLCYPPSNTCGPYLSPAPLYKFFFPRYLLNCTIFEKMLLNIKCLFRFSLQMLSETFFILRITERDMIKNVYRSSCKVPVILVRFLWNLGHLNSFSKNTQISNFMKIRPVGAELLPGDRRTDGRHDG